MPTLGRGGRDAHCSPTPMGHGRSCTVPARAQLSPYKGPHEPNASPEHRAEPPPGDPKGSPKYPRVPRGCTRQSPPRTPSSLRGPPRSSGSGRSHFHPEPAGTSPDTAPSNLRLLIANSANCQHRSIERNRAGAAPCAPSEGRGGGGARTHQLLFWGGGRMAPGAPHTAGGLRPPAPPPAAQRCGEGSQLRSADSSELRVGSEPQLLKLSGFGFFPFFFSLLLLLLLLRFSSAVARRRGCQKSALGF